MLDRPEVPRWRRALVSFGLAEDDPVNPLYPRLPAPRSSRGNLWVAAFHLRAVSGGGGL